MDAFDCIANKIKNLSGKQDPDATQSTANETQALQAVTQQVQLPKINLPTFDGNFLQWTSFKDQFSALVHKVDTLDNVRKFLYLKSCLTGEAADVLANYAPTNEGYLSAYTSLKERYDNPRILSGACMRTLFEIDAVKNSNAADLKNLINAFKQAIRAMEGLKKPIDSWDEWFVFLLSDKLDKSTRLHWETSLSDSKAIPKFNQMITFLENRVHALENTNSSIKNKSNNAANNKGHFQKVNSCASSTNKPTYTCTYCSDSHVTTKCTKFKALSPIQRKDHVVQNRLCFLCLKANHSSQSCKSTYRCNDCKGKHNILLHDALMKNSQSQKAQRTQPEQERTTYIADNSVIENEVAAYAATYPASTRNRVVLMSTALVKLVDRSGKSMVVRALLDNASNTSFISEHVAQTLNVQRYSVKTSLFGITAVRAGNPKQETQISVCPVDVNEPMLPFSPLIVDKVTRDTPNVRVKNCNWPHISGLKLADPTYATPGPIDAIIGAELTGWIYTDGTRASSLYEPVAKLTIFGWVLTGRTAPPNLQFDNTLPSTIQTFSCCVDFDPELFWEFSFSDDNQVDSRSITCLASNATADADSSCDTDSQPCSNCELQRFWEVDELHDPKMLSDDEASCEQMFTNSVRRDTTGRYVVPSFFKLDPERYLQSNYNTASRLLLSLEKRLKDHPISAKYFDFMEAYKNLNHMTLSFQPNNLGYFIPHHGVFKTHDPNGKIRVVFNGSSKTSSGYSLNDCLHAGPKLQKDIWIVLTRWRFHRIAFTADIVKMYRQILIAPEDRKWQRILWRESSAEVPSVYDLNTVTYGPKSSPYIALRVIEQLAHDEKDKFPIGSDVLLHDNYVDDFYACADNIADAAVVQNELIRILRAVGFELDKWASNVSGLSMGAMCSDKNITQTEGISTLGLWWNVQSNNFSLKVSTSNERLKKPTKRSVLSDLARLFDPQGWFCPVLIFAKIVIQDTWLLNVEWDQPLPHILAEKWTNFYTSLSHLEAIFSAKGGLC
uniref:Peptidase aspartic putative domain-containing protein n=1 Tax=Trichogramma kaykai TaxID=54128 RepID=A0ABD2WXB2_9HYME